MKTFLCGAAREIITPPVGTLLYGYIPDLVSESVHDDLTASVIAFGGEETVLLVSLTLGDLQTALADELRETAAEASGTDPKNVIVAATHTHCGPNTSGVEGWGDVDRPYVDGILIPALKKAASDAVRSMVPAEVGIATGLSEVGINRREICRGGSVKLGQNPWGCYDPNMTVMAFRRTGDHRGIVNLIHYGCHGTACGCATEITRDWSGIMTDRVETLSETLTVFFNGAIGDVGPRLTNGETVGNIGYVEELGGVAAQDAVRIFRKIRDYRQPELSLRKGTVWLPYQELPRLETVLKELERIQEPEKLNNLRRLRWKYLTDVKNRIESGDTEIPEDFSFPFTAVILGDTVFLPIPFEHFAETSMYLRRYSGFGNTLTLSCANGYNGYLPTEGELSRGGYEVGVFRYASLWSLADDTAQNLADEALRILESE